MNKICIFGVGGVGGYFGGKITLANPDKKIFFIARGKTWSADTPDYRII